MPDAARRRRPGSCSCSWTASARSAADDGSRRGTQSSGIRSRVTVSVSRMTWPMSIVEMPSTSVWWDFTRIANRPPSSPSMRYISHSGRVRSSGRAMIRATSSSSCSIEPGRGQRRLAHVVGDVEVVVVDPHRAGQAAGHGHEPLAVARDEREPVADERHELCGSRTPPRRARTPRPWPGASGVSAESMASSAMSPGRSRSTWHPSHGSASSSVRFCQRSGEALRRLCVKGFEMVFEHGIGGSQDLPISLPFALAGGAAALAVSFIVLALAWREPRFDAATQGRPLPARLAAAVDGGLARSCAAARSACSSPAYVALGGAGRARQRRQPHLRRRLRAAVGRPRAGVLAVRAVLPGGQPGAHPPPAAVPGHRRRPGTGRAAAAVAGSGCGRPPSASSPSCGSSWCAPEANFLWAVRLWFAVYVAVLVVGAAVFGDRWIAAADPFEAYSTLVGHLSVFGRTADGTLVVRSPLREPRRGARPSRVWSPCSGSCWAARRSTASRTRSPGCGSARGLDVAEVLLNTAGAGGRSARASRLSSRWPPC